MKVSVITPTCDRPVGLALAEAFMARQTQPPDEWIVADGGAAPAVCTRGQQHLYERTVPGPANFATNLLNALQAATGDVLVVMEDDDWYAAEHLAALVARLTASPETLIAGDDEQRYYNVRHRRWRVFENHGGCLCQTAFRRELIPQLQDIIRTCATRKSYGIDTAFWASVPTTAWALARARTVLGIKGLPGQVGLGIGHRPGAGWHDDADLAVLRGWIGDDAAHYEAMNRAEVAA